MGRGGGKGGKSGSEKRGREEKGRGGRERVVGEGEGAGGGKGQVGGRGVVGLLGHFPWAKTRMFQYNAYAKIESATTHAHSMH